MTSAPPPGFDPYAAKPHLRVPDRPHRTSSEVRAAADQQRLAREVSETPAPAAREAHQAGSRREDGPIDGQQLGETSGMTLAVLACPASDRELRAVLRGCRDALRALVTYAGTTHPAVEAEAARTSESASHSSPLGPEVVVDVLVAGGEGSDGATAWLVVRAAGRRCACGACQGADAQVWADAGHPAPSRRTTRCPACGTGSCPRALHHIYRCRTR